MIQIGRYQLDEEEMVLSGDGQRVLLEPKVFEVLTYFCQNHNRYISMAELHDTIWQGRCVSDAAVRRIISKIRLLVNDDHKNPTYIQSLPKRGYKLICTVEYGVAEEPTSLPTTPLSETSEHQQQAEENQNLLKVQLDGNIEQIDIVRKKPVWMIATVAMLLVAMVILLGLLTTSWLFPATIETQIVNTLPGDKIAVTQSADGSYLAFSGQVHEESGFQIYVKHKSDFDFKPITQQAHLPGALAFSADNQFLYFSDSTQNNSSLNRIKVNDHNSKKEVVADNYAVISDVFTARTTNDIFFAAKKTVEQPFLIYQYDMNTGNIRAITSSSQAENLDIKGDISFDGSKLVVLRKSRLSHINEIRVIDLKTQEVLLRRQERTGIFDVAWRDDSNLLLLKRKKIITLNIKNGDVVTAPIVGQELINLDSSHKRIISINLGAIQKLFMEKKLPFNVFETKRLIQKDIYHLSYFGDKNLALIKGNGVTQLGFIDLESDSFDSILATEYSLAVLDVSPKYGQILVRINRRFALLDPNKVDLEYITSGDDFIGDAAYSMDGSKVLFTTKNFEQWSAYTFDLDTQAVEQLIENVRFIRPFKMNYIIGNPEGELFIYNENQQDKVQLNHFLSKEPNTHWTVRGDNVYWSTHDLVDTTFNQLNLTDLNNPTLLIQEFSYNQVDPDFNIDAGNKRFLMSQTKNMTSEVVELIVD